MKALHFVLLVFAIVLLVSQVDAQWVQVGLANQDIREIACGNSSLFARNNFDREDTLVSDGRLFRSTDGGASWSPRPEFYISNIAVAPNGSVYTIRNWSNDWRDSLCRSSDNGSTWTVDSLPNDGHRASWYCNMAIGPSGNLFVSWWSVWQWVWWSAFSMSTDGGSSWMIDSVWYTYGYFPCAGVAFAFKGGFVETVGWAGGHSGNDWRRGFFSADYGHTWTMVREDNGVGPGTVGARLAWCSNGNIFLGNGQVWLSADTGATWSQCANFNNAAGTALLALPQGGVLVGTDTTGVYFFTDDGDSLGTLNEGLTDLHIHTFAVDGSGYAYVGTNDGIWRRPVSELVVSVNPSASRMPQEFVLSQNYPNPFNPSTTIRYELPRASHVTLTVYDVLGREVATLVDDAEDPGYKSVEWNAGGVASGVYFYRLKAGEFVQTRKLLVLR